MLLSEPDIRHLVFSNVVQMIAEWGFIVGVESKSFSKHLNINEDVLENTLKELDQIGLLFVKRKKYKGEVTYELKSTEHVKNLIRNT